MLVTPAAEAEILPCMQFFKLLTVINNNNNKPTSYIKFSKLILDGKLHSFVVSLQNSSGILTSFYTWHTNSGTHNSFLYGLYVNCLLNLG